MGQSLTKTDIRRLLDTIEDRLGQLYTYENKGGREEAKKLMRLANKVADRMVYDTNFPTESEFAFLKMVYVDDENFTRKTSVRLSRLRTTRLRYAKRFLKLGYLKLETPEHEDQPDRLAVTELGYDRILMKYRR